MSLIGRFDFFLEKIYSNAEAETSTLVLNTYQERIAKE